MKRREMIQKTAGLAGLCATGGGLASLPAPTQAATSTGGPKRVIFFLQNQAFSPIACIPKGVKGDTTLEQVTLPEPLAPLEPYKERLHIINGLHGRHTSPMHSAYFGALGGYRGGHGVAPSGTTIDYALSQVLPETVMPHLAIGFDSLEAMESAPTIANLSASDLGKPVHMYSHPVHLYNKLFGSIASGDIRKRHEARSEVRLQLESMAQGKGRPLPFSEKQRYDGYVQGFRDINSVTAKLNSMTDHLKQFAPERDDRYTNPEFETDWHDVLLEIGISALTSGITNVLTIGSGRGSIYGSWKGLEVETVGHRLGHIGQLTDEWVKIRQYNCRMLVRLMEALEGMPEGSGTMMDHTLIVYLSNNAEAQHSSGKNWPLMLLGNLDGRLKTNQLTQLDGSRPINALYSTLMHVATGEQQTERFNMSKTMAAKFDAGEGMLTEVLA